MKRAIIYVVILGLVCTALGIAIGVVIEKRYTSKYLPKIVRAYFLRHPEKHNLLRKRLSFLPGEKRRAKRRRALERIDRELNLSLEQKDKVKAILERARQEIKQARDEFRAQLTQVRERSNAQILGLLNPEQKEKFQDLTTKFKR